jgi:hypothetical protein
MATLQDIQAAIARKQQQQASQPGVTLEQIRAAIARKQQAQPQTDPQLLQLQDLLVRQSKGEQGLQDQITQLRGSAGAPDDSRTISGMERFKPEAPAGTSKFSQALNVLGQTKGISDVGTGVESFARGAKQGLLNIGSGLFEGIGQARKALGDESAQDFLNELEITRSLERERTKQITAPSPIAGIVGEITGEIAGLPLPAVRSATVPGKIAQAGVTSATAGAITGAGKGDDVINSALLGAGFGAGFQGLTSAGQNLARKFINARAGNFKTDDVSELVKISQREGIDLFADDAAAAPILEKLGVLAENVPGVGTAAGRLRQSAQQAKAAQKLGDELSGDLDNFALEAKSGLQRRLARVKKAVGLKFKNVSRKLDRFGQIDKTGFNNQITKEIESEMAKGTRANQDLIKVLESFKNAPNGNFSAIRSQRSDLGDEISKFYTGDDRAIGAKGVEKLQRIKNSLELDINEFVAKTGSKQDIEAFRKANDFTVKNLIPFKETQLARLVDRKAEPEAIISFLKAGRRPGRANLLFNSLDNRGRQAVMADLVETAINKATTGRKAFSANTFASELEKVQNATDVFFRGANKERIEGLKKIMRATARAGQVAENPPTGARLLLPGAGIGAATDLGATAAAMGGFGALSKMLLQTKPGRTMLAGLGKATENTKNFDNIIQKINELAKRSAISTNTGEQQ